MEADRFELLNNRRPRRFFTEPVEFVLSNLDARQIAVVTDAELAKMKPLHEQLAGGDLLQPFEIDFSAVGKARGKAGTGRLVPSRQTELAAVAADVVLGHPRIDQRMADTPCFSRLEPRP